MSECERCDRPMPDQAYTCPDCGVRTPTRQLATIAEHTPAARDVAHSLTRRGPDVAGGTSTRLPINLTATARLDAVQNTLTTWARLIAQQRGVPLPGASEATDPIVAVAEWLPAHLEWSRHQHAIAADLLADVGAAYRIVVNLADGPGPRHYLGPCGAPASTLTAEQGSAGTTPCDGDVYARDGAVSGTCRTCGARHDVAARRAWLDDEVRSRAFRAAHIADAYRINANTIRSWAARGLLRSFYAAGDQLVAWDDTEDEDLTERGHRLHLVGDVLDLAAADAARRAEQQARRARRQTRHDEEGAA